MVTAASGQLCTLCGNPSYHALQGARNEVFCCRACKEVAALISETHEVQDAAILENAERASATFSLGGLWCSSCAWLIEERLKRSSGVLDCQVSFGQQEAIVEYDSARTDEKRLARLIRSLGYRIQDADGEREEGAFFTRMLVGGMLAMHIMALSAIIYARQLLGIHDPETYWLADFFHLMQFALSVPMFFVLAVPIIRAGIAGLLRGLPNTQTLVAFGAVVGFSLSARNFFAKTGPVYFDTAAMLVFLITIGRWLEMRAHKAGLQAVDHLAEQIPSTAIVLKGQMETPTPVQQVRVGMRVRVLPGQAFPVDGIVAKGQGDVDESLLTGEPEPVLRAEGEAVHAGTLSLDGVFEIITSAVGVETKTGQIGWLLHQALWQRSPTERQADKLAAWMIPLSIALAGGTFIYWHFQAGLETGLLNALSVLLIACPCALGLATPLTLWQALARAAASGVIFRSTSAVEKLACVRSVFFDKTGTLSQLPLQVVELFVEGMDPDRFLSLIAGVEANTTHPLGQAVVDSAQEKGLELLPVEQFKSIPGLGVQAVVDGKHIFLGSLRFMEKNQLVGFNGVEQQVSAWHKTGYAIIYAGWDGLVRGAVALGETVRPEAKDAIENLKKTGSQVFILTGDDRRAGERWARSLGVTVFSELSPSDKVDHLAQHPDSSAMVGDGINDGLALAAAETGFALHTATDVARSAAEVILLRSDLSAIPWSLDLSRHTNKKIKQNLIWAFFYNLIGISLAVTGVLQPVLAALAMVGSSLMVTYNALSIKRFPTLQHTNPSQDNH